MSGSGPDFQGEERRYRLVEVLGRGAFGVVWRAELHGARGFHKPVAIKILDAERGETWARRLRDEARVLSMVHHRAVVAVEELVCLDGRWAVVMELVEGWDLAELLSRGPVPPRVAAEIVGEVAQALEAIHSAAHPGTGEPLELVHRDLKPANLRLTPAGEVKVLDFGISRARFDEREARTLHTRMGSTGYLAPERFRGQDLPAGDVYAAGVLLAEALLGRGLGQLPGRPGPFHARLLAILDALAPLPEALVDLVGSALSFEPLGRPTAHDLGRALRDLAPTLEGPWLADWVAELEAPVVAVPAPDLAEVLGLDGPRYEVGELLGKGGIARVYRARDRHLDREVALKELALDGGASRSDLSPTGSSVVRRFLQEARVTGQLDHPSVVPVYEVGVRPDGALFYTMRRARGQTLESALAAAADLDERLGLLPHLVDVCQAVAAAHARGVVHRDLKPANIMVGDFGETAVLDWGLAKVRGQEDLRGEEVASRARDHLDAGQTRDGQALGTPRYMSPEQAAGEVDAVDERSDVWSLGVVLFELLAGRPAFPGSARQAVDRILACEVPEVPEDAPADLAAVCRRALRPDPAERYPSAAHVADELGAWLTGRRVDAYEYGPVELLRRALSRHRWAVAGVSVALALLAGQGVLTWSRVRAEHRQTRSHLADVRLEAAEAALVRQDLPRARALVRGALEIGDSARGRALWARMERERLRWSRSVDSDLRTLALATDGDPLVVLDGSRRLLVVDMATGRYREVGRHDKAVDVAAISPDERGAAMGAQDGHVVVWDLETGNSRDLAAHTKPVRGLGYGPDGDWLVSASRDGAVRWWDVGSGAMVREVVLGERLRALDVGPDGAVAVSSSEGGLWLVDGEEVRALERQPDSILTLDLGEAGLLMGTWTGEVRLLDLESGVSRQVDDHGKPVLSVRHRPDGGWVGLGHAGLVRWESGEWPMPNGRELATGPGGLIAVATDRGLVVSLEVDRPRLPARGHGGLVTSAEVSADGALAATVGPHSGVHLWDLPELRERAVLPSPRPSRMDLSADGRWVAIGGEDGLVHLWQASPPRLVRTLFLEGTVHGLAFRGEELLGASVTGTVVVWSVPDGEVVARESLVDEILDADIAPGGQVVLATNKGLALWEPGGAVTWSRRGRAVFRVAVSGVGHRAAWSAVGETFGLIDLRTGATEDLVSLDQPPQDPDFSPDGASVAYSARGLHLRDLARGTERTSSERDYQSAVRFVTEDELLVVGEEVGTWDAGTLERRTRAPALWAEGGRALVGTHEGWIDPRTGRTDVGPGGGWDLALSTRYTTASADGSTLCLWRGGVAVDQVDAGTGELLAAHLADGVVGYSASGFGGQPPNLALHAIPGGCVTASSASVQLHRPGREPLTLAEGQSARVTTGASFITVSSAGALVRYDYDGVEVGTRPAGEGIEALVQAGGDLLLDRGSGVEIHRSDGTVVELQGRPYPREAILAPAGDALVIGTWEGEVGLWDRATGGRLDHARLNGRIEHLALAGTTVVAASVTGDHLAWDLDVLARDRCEVLREVWAASPEGLVGGRLAEQPPPADHACAP